MYRIYNVAKIDSVFGWTLMTLYAIITVFFNNLGNSSSPCGPHMHTSVYDAVIYILYTKVFRRTWNLIPFSGDIPYMARVLFRFHCENHKKPISFIVSLFKKGFLKDHEHRQMSLLNSGTALCYIMKQL